MPVKITVPAKTIKELIENTLMLENAQRCSRCGRSPASFFEVHKAYYRVGKLPNRLYGKKFKFSKSFKLKIGICETCYQTDYLTHPDRLDRNGSSLAKISSFHSATWMIGVLLAAFGFILLTPIVPEIGVLTTLKQSWQIPVGVGVIVLLLTWLSQKKYQNKVLQELETSAPGFMKRSRASITTLVLENETDLSMPALEVSFENEDWAVELAEVHHWQHIRVDAAGNEIPDQKERGK